MLIVQYFQDEWPEHIASEYATEYEPKTVFGDKTDIEEYLRKAARILYLTVVQYAVFSTTPR